MKKFFIILAINFIAIPTFASDWKKIDNGLYLDMQSIATYEGSYLYPHENTYSFWSKIIYDGSPESKNSLKGTNSIG